jgi:hypothetical protein
VIERDWYEILTYALDDTDTTPGCRSAWHAGGAAFIELPTGAIDQNGRLGSG